MKKSYLKRLICFGVAALVLCSALAVAAVTGSPYETLKNAAFKGLEITNGTVSCNMSIALDGVELIDSSQSETRYISEDVLLTVSGERDYYYSSTDYSVMPWYGYGSDKGVWYNASSGSIYFSSNSFVINPAGSMSAAERRFAELFLDLFVGNLKNNLSMYEEGDIRYISGTLTEAQMPEIVNAFLDVMAYESTGHIDEEDYHLHADDEMPLPKKVRITYAHGDAQVDGDGNLIAVSGEAKVDYVDIFDKEHELVVSVSLDITDVGTTVPECPIPGVKELLDEYNSDGTNFSDIRFKLNEDGTIDKTSVFDNMGGGLLNNYKIDVE